MTLLHSKIIFKSILLWITIGLVLELCLLLLHISVIIICPSEVSVNCVWTVGWNYQSYFSNCHNKGLNSQILYLEVLCYVCAALHGFLNSLPTGTEACVNNREGNGNKSYPLPHSRKHSKSTAANWAVARLTDLLKGDECSIWLFNDYAEKYYHFVKDSLFWKHSYAACMWQLLFFPWN